ncbi:MAG: ADOP family duplicated permease [Gemmatimonas sp.]
MRIRLKQKRLLEILSSSPLSQNHWAIKLGLSRGHWSDIVNGNHPYPSAKTRARLLDAFVIPFEELFEVEAAAEPWVDRDIRQAIMDRYIIDREIGQGGMGAVYLGRDVRHGRLVAVKVIAPEAVSGIGIQQFRREVSTVAQLHHPHILPLYESGDVHGLPYFVMPWVRAGSLRARLKERTRLPLSETLTLVLGISNALQYAHAERVLHCDVKPENVLLYGIHPWVTDFGIARRLHGDLHEWPKREGLDTSAGTPAYVSPEQASGETDLDPRSDIYSLGCMVYEMLAGRAPFDGTTTQDIVASRFLASAQSLRDFAPELPRSVEAVIANAMSVSRKHRIESAAEFASELTGAANVNARSRVFMNAQHTGWRAVDKIQRRLHLPTQHPVGGIVRSLLEDIRFAIRVSARNRLVTIAVVLTMVLGIASTTSVFSVVNSVLLSRLPFDDSERVVRIGMTVPDGSYNVSNAYPDFLDYERNARTFSALSAAELTASTLTEGDAAEQLLTANVSDGFRDVFGIHTAIGRWFAPEDFATGGARVVVISNRLWKRRFGGDRTVIGRTIRLENEAVTVVGVLSPMAYTYPAPGIEMLAPLRPAPGSFHLNRGALWLRIAGKVKPGVSLEQAQADIATVAAGIARQFPDAYTGLGTRVERLQEVEAKDARQMLGLLAAAVAGVLLIACVNIASILLGQARARSREFAVRAALGGSGVRIRRQILTESMLLATAGGTLGILLAPTLTKLLVQLYPGGLPRAQEITIDFRVLGVAVLATLLAGVLAGLPTAKRAGTHDLTRELRNGARAGNSRIARRAGRVLVASQVAVSLALLFSAVLFLATFRTLSKADPGFQSRGITTLQLIPPRARYAGVVDLNNYFEAVDRKLLSLPGVTSVAMSTELPFNGSSSSDAFLMKELGDQGANNPQTLVATVSPNFWSVMSVPTIDGRTFTREDGAQAPRVAVVNTALAKRYYPNTSPVGHVIVFNGAEWQIVGVVASVSMTDLTTSPVPELFVSTQQFPRRARYLLVKSSVLPTSLFVPIQHALNELDRTIAVTELQSMDDRVSLVMAPQRFRAALISGLGFAALLLSALGIYGVVAQNVARQTREIGIRLALGETDGRVRWRVIGEALRVAALGAALGVMLSLALSRWLSGFIVGVTVYNPIMLGATALLLMMVALTAAYIPARRASRSDPLSALRSE